MAAITPTPPVAVQPAFKRIQQSDDFDCAFACVATIVGKSLDEVRKAAVEKYKLPAHGPYWVTEGLISLLLGHYGFSATEYREVMKLGDIADVALCLVDYDEATELGRHVVFVRDKRNPKQPVEYLIDPAYWKEPSEHVRVDVKSLAPAWYIGVQLIPKSGAAGK